MISPISFKSTMFTTDLDGTMMFPVNEGGYSKGIGERKFDTKVIQSAQQAVKENGIEHVMINTGRNFSEFSEFQDYFKSSDMPIDAISLEDGKRLLKKPQQYDTKTWLELLFNKNINYMSFADEKWTKKNKEPIKAMQDFLTEEGYVHRFNEGENLIYTRDVRETDEGVTKLNKKSYWEVTILPSGINFETRLRHSSDGNEIDLEKYNKHLTQKIEQMLKSKGFDVKNANSKKITKYSNSLDRTDINKGARADYIRQINPDIKGEIRAGNADNDIPMLKTSTPNTQVIQVGNDTILSEHLNGQKNVTHTPDKELGNGINEAYKKLNLIA